jgi:hypothetical protein
MTIHEDDGIRIALLDERWDVGDRQTLSDALARCPDVAFAYLAEVEVPGQAPPSPVVFVWLRPPALRSLRGALNLVSETVSRVIPGSSFVDVVILNSAPDLLMQAEAAGALLVEADPEERVRALRALEAEAQVSRGDEGRGGRWWWPF